MACFGVETCKYGVLGGGIVGVGGCCMDNVGVVAPDNKHIKVCVWGEVQKGRDRKFRAYYYVASRNVLSQGGLPINGDPPILLLGTGYPPGESAERRGRHCVGWMGQVRGMWPQRCSIYGRGGLSGNHPYGPVGVPQIFHHAPPPCRGIIR